MGMRRLGGNVHSPNHAYLLEYFRIDTYSLLKLDFSVHQIPVPSYLSKGWRAAFYSFS